ncbi:unnamed protein product [Prorocentrum cordatum]|uniref:Uncharacterized protein n=1 Tax=Prorocentrum cordatum TaxID=2364126 RepID=A0ABN9XNQ5_9DINO|nr:unnamed protein product [Polarella glacialis]
MAVQAQAFSCRECNWDECEECCGKTQDHLGIQGLWKARGNHRRFKIVRTTDSPSDLEINGFVITGRYQEGWWAKGTLKENGQWYQGCVREEQGERTGFVRVHLWDTNEIVTNFREKEDSPWGADSLLMRSARVKVNPKVLCIAQNSIEQICAQLRSGETASDSAAALLESRVEDSSAWRSLPVPGQQLVVLPSQGLEVAGREYYREGDAGRVSSEVYLDGNGDKAFDVTWLRTGLTWRMSKDWASRVRIVGAAPAFGEEVEALPGAEFTNGSGTEFYAPGDRGRVSSDLRLVPVQGRSELRFGVAWYRSGLVSFMTAEGWTKKFNVVGSARTLVLGDEVQALPGQKLTVDGVVYYSEGDVGRVTNVGIRKNDDLDACEGRRISWYKSGRSSVQTVESWPKTVRLIEGEEKSNLVGVEDKRIIEEAVASQEVTMAKPMQLVSGQPKEAAKGLYHMMRVKDPFADDSAARIEQEVDSFVKDLKESAVVLALLEAKQGDADEVRRIENFYGGEEAISRAKGDIEYFGKGEGVGSLRGGPQRLSGQGPRPCGPAAFPWAQEREGRRACRAARGGIEALHDHGF